MKQQEVEKMHQIGRVVEKEFNKEILDSMLVHTIAFSQTINKGNNGIIKKVNTDDFPPEFISYLNLENNIDINKSDSYVFKMLKVYTKGRAKNEFYIQKKAYDLVERSTKDNGDIYAKIPRPYLYREIPIDKEIKKILKNDGIDFVYDNVEVILMDYIDGEDMAEKLYKEVIRRHPRSKHLRHEELEQMQIEELQKEVGRVLDFNLPGGKGKDEIERKIEEKKVFDENSEKIIRFLQKSGYVLDSAYLEKLSNTIKLLHDNGINHGDLHERNIMFEKTASDNLGRVDLLDFGEATVEEDGILIGEKKSLKGKRLISDTMVLNKYSELTAIYDPFKEIKKEISELDNQYGQLDLLRNVEDKFNGYDINDIDNKSSRIAQSITGIGTSDEYWNVKIYILSKIMAKQNPAKLKNVVEGLLSKNKNIYFTNKLTKLYSMISKANKKIEAT